MVEARWDTPERVECARRRVCVLGVGSREARLRVVGRLADVECGWESEEVDRGRGCALEEVNESSAVVPGKRIGGYVGCCWASFVGRPLTCRWFIEWESILV